MTWDTIGAPFTATITAIAFQDSLTGFVGDEDGRIRFTNDGGETWTDEVLPREARPIARISIVDGVVCVLGGTDYIFRRRLVTSVSESGGTPVTRGLSVVPNPSVGRFRLSGGLLEHGRLVVTDVTGRVVHRNDTYTIGDEVTLAGIAPGMYSLRFEGTSGIRTSVVAITAP